MRHLLKIICVVENYLNDLFYLFLKQLTILWHRYHLESISINFFLFSSLIFKTDINFLNSSINSKNLPFFSCPAKTFLFLLFYSLDNLLTFIYKSFIFCFIVYSFLLLFSTPNFHFTFIIKFLNYKFLANLFFFD